MRRAIQREHQISLAENTLFSTHQPVKALPGLLQQLLSLGAHHVRVQILLSESNLALSLEETAERYPSLFHLTVLVKESEYFSARLEGEVGRENKKALSGRFVIFKHPSEPLAWILVLRDESEFERRLLNRFLRRARPRLTRPLLNSAQLRQIFEVIAELPSVTEFRLTEIGQRTWIQSEGATKAVEADRRWTDITIAEAFGEAKETGFWVIDATGGFDYKGSTGVGLKVTREGIVTFIKVISSLFWVIVDRIASMGAARFRFLTGRARSQGNQFYSRPFSIRFDKDAVRSSEDLSRLVDVLEDMAFVAFTPMHVNPYFHASMLDFSDGSSYDVYILDEDRMTIVPQGRATVQALQRLCGKVFSDFREGSLEEVENDK